MDYNNLEELYEFLESTDLKSKSQMNLTRGFFQLSESTTDLAIKEKIRTETFVFDFELSSGKTSPLGSRVTEDGTTVFEYPSFSDFNENSYTYLKERAKIVKNDFLIARYNQVLWNSTSKDKHQAQAKTAIDAYLRILNKLDFAQEDKASRMWECIDLLKNGFALALQIKYKVSEFKSLIKSWLYEAGKFPPDHKILILEYMVELPQLTKEDFDNSLQLVEKIGEEHVREKIDYFLTKNIFEAGLHIARRIGSDQKIWNERIGDAVVRMAEHRMNDETKMIPIGFYNEAIPYFKAAGKNEKVKNAEQRLFELKKELKLSKVRVPISEEDGQKLLDFMRAKAEKLLEKSPKEIFGHLLSGTDIFPSKNALLEMSKKNTFQDFVTVMEFDINKNISTAKGAKEEKEKARIYESYNLYMRLCTLPFLHILFVEGIKKGKLTFAELVKFIEQHSWLGQELTERDSAQDEIHYKWISLLAPSLHEYFLQTEAALRSRNPQSNYVMPIDSLTLKFEGMLRDFAKLSNVTTTIAGKNNRLREKYIEELLVEEEIKKHFDEDDLLFFNYLFVAKKGLNLRTNIAHSFYRYNHYSFQLMHLLICAVLRIGKYKITEQ